MVAVYVDEKRLSRKRTTNVEWVRRVLQNDSITFSTIRNEEAEQEKIAQRGEQGFFEARATSTTRRCRR